MLGKTLDYCSLDSCSVQKMINDQLPRIIRSVIILALAWAVGEVHTCVQEYATLGEQCK